MEINRETNIVTMSGSEYGALTSMLKSFGLEIKMLREAYNKIGLAVMETSDDLKEMLDVEQARRLAVVELGKSEGWAKLPDEVTAQVEGVSLDNVGAVKNGEAWKT